MVLQSPFFVMADRFQFALYPMLGGGYCVNCVVLGNVLGKAVEVFVWYIRRLIWTVTMLQGAILTTMLATRNFSSKYASTGK